MTAPAPRTADVYAVSVPVGVFTGDFYHFADGRDGVWFALGDVTGHGLDSAIFMAMIQELIEERWTGHRPADGWTRCPSAAVAWIHEALAPELPVHRFVSRPLHRRRLRDAVAGGRGARNRRRRRLAGGFWAATPGPSPTA